MPITSKVKDTEAGFTLIELLMAMAIFSFMLMIVVIGFINVVHIHNQAVAANIAEDNARTAMDELVRAVRTSNGVLPSAANTLCLTNTSSGGETIYYVAHPFPLTPLVGVLTRANSPRVLGTPNCVVPGTSPQAITSSIVSVTAFSGVVPPGNIFEAGGEFDTNGGLE